jgi:hypothetical protein
MFGGSLAVMSYNLTDIDNVFSEGINCKRLMKASNDGLEPAKVIEKKRNEQADLWRREVTTS